VTEPQYKPNVEIDKAIKDLLSGIKKDTAPDTACKIVNTAIAWEKVKLGAINPKRTFDPDELDT
jgi:hypothetical protein